MNNKEIGQMIFRVALYMNSFSYISNATGNEILFSLFSRSYIIISIVLLILLLPRNNRNRIIILTGLFFSCLGAYMLHHGGIDLYSFMITLLQFFALPIYFICVPQLGYDERIFRSIRNATVITALFFIIKWQYAPDYGSNGLLTLGFFNANAAGIYLFQNIVLMLCIMQYARYKTFYLICSCIEVFILYLTQCRTAFLCVIIFVLLMLFKEYYAEKKWVTNLFIFAPLLFVVIQNMLYMNGWLNDVMIFGKPLFSGREEFFVFMFRDFLRNPILGDFGTYQLGNAHNAYFSVACSLGSVGFLFFYAFYYGMVHYYREKQDKTRIQYLAFVGILMLFVEGSSEAACLVAGSMYAFATAPLIYCMAYDELDMYYYDEQASGLI